MNNGIPRPLKVLLVENHADTQRLVKMYLEHQGHHVTAAGTKAEAVAAASEAVCDVLISDIGLPDGDGWELLTLLNEAHFRRPVFAIAMSGYGSRGDYQRSSAAGFRLHIVKPFEPDALDAALEEAAREIGG